MATAAEAGLCSTLDVWADPANERIGTSATVITVVRTVASVALAGVAAARARA